MIATRTNRVLSAEEAVELLRRNAAELRDNPDAGVVETFDYGCDGRVVRVDVLGYDIDRTVEGAAHTATLQMHYLTDEEIPFCDRDRKDLDEITPNVWRTSTIRAVLNEQMFIEEHFGELAEHILTAIKSNDGDEETEDKIFLLSREEIDPEESVYPYYRAIRTLARVTSDGVPDWYRLRSASRGTASSPWYVGSSGYVNSYYDACYAHRALPSLVIDIS